jgi:hypothetical protein
MSSDYTSGKGIVRFPVTIANAASLSSAALIGGYTLCGFQIPSAMTGTQISIHGSTDDGATFLPVKDGSAADRKSTIQTAEAGIYTLNPGDFAGISQIKLKSNGTEGAERTLYVLAIKAASEK